MKNLFSLLFFSLLTTILTAQFSFEEQLLVNLQLPADRVETVHSSDLDGDGDLDLLSASYNDDKIAWYENTDGQGNFGLQKIIATNINGASSAFSADLDGDGDQDVIATGSFTGVRRMSWYENTDGLGNFGPEQLLSTTSSLADAGDIDGDGDLDLLTYEGQDDWVVWRENMDGQGNFGPAQNIVFLDGADPQLSDIDGDGDLDILALRSTAFINADRVLWYENTDGLGNFGPEKIVNDDIDIPSAFFPADVDGDGDMDVLAASTGGLDEVKWYENTDGLGNFGPENLITNTLLNVKSLFANDVDGDGDLDVVFGAATIGLVGWIENTDGLGTFETITNLSRDVEGATSVLAADLDNDGDSDIVYGSGIDNKVGWFENLDGLGTFPGERLITTAATISGTVSSADLDADGDMDVLLSSSSYNKILWYENTDGLGTLGPENVIINNLDRPQNIYPADLDGDGDLDLLSASSTNTINDKIAWFENDGLGNFGPIQEISDQAQEATDVYAIDVDGDGDLDVLSASQWNDKITWFKNTDGAGNFEFVAQLPSTSFEAQSVFAGDLDGDGDMDVLSASKGDEDISWYENIDGLGDFEAHLIDTDAEDAYDVFATDLDGDGDLDVIAAANGADQIIWYKNNGLGVFSSPIVITSNAIGARSVFTADVDGDGDPDVLSASEGDHKIAWYENTDGLGTFGTQQIIANNVFNTRSVHATDLDGDGKMDILSTFISDPADATERLAWYKNEGINANEIKGFVRLDLDNDGCDGEDLPMSDLMVVNTTGTTAIAKFTTVNGFHQAFVGEDDFTTSLTAILPEYYGASPDFYMSNFVGLGNIDSADFCLQPSQLIDDLSISFFPISEARPGFDADYELVFRNSGTTQLTGTIDLSFDDTKQIFLAASEIPSAQSNNTITFDYTDLNPFETRSIQLEFNTFQPPVVVNGDSLFFTAIINPVAADFTPLNNEFSLNQISIGSFDPNDITVLEGEEILLEEADDYLHYLIRFQNTGTASAINVRVENNLDANLDWQSLQLESLSHSYRVEVTDGNMVSFIFDEIYLPDSTTNEPASHGFIAYKIKPISDIMLGDVIQNQADIYFDFNTAVETNIVSTTIIPPPDFISPIAICQDVTLELDDMGMAALESASIDAGSTDNIGIASLTVVPNTFTCAEVGASSIVLFVADLAGNMDSCSAVVELVDLEIPMVLAQDITVDLNGASSISITPDQVDNGSFDNCGIAQMNLDQTSFATVGEYPVTLTVEDINNNTNTSVVMVAVINSVSTEDVLFSASLVVSPNPVRSILNIDAKEEVVKMINIYSADGQLVFSGFGTTLTISDLSDGAYLLEVITESGKRGMKQILKKK